MSINLALLILLFLIILYITIIEIFTVILMLTGVSNTRAKFQVISLLTNCGFTTTESEIIVCSRKRRKSAITIMLFGNIFNVAIVSLLVNTVISFSRNKDFDVVHSILYLLIFLAFITIMKKIPFFRVSFDNVVKRIATKLIFSKKANPMLIFDNFHGFVIVEIKIVEVPEKLNNMTLLETRISNDYGIRVLNIKREDLLMGDISKDEVIMKNDRVMVYGHLANIIDVFEQKPSHYSRAN
ncbi:TrkA C-terminal domain-containing protein [Clostridium bowmanii]|uniref:TrkA C-terminal domain-containing protein n=1 Tax=Clostridium bowmanii TaxID=132925 RepID=UPI001C0D08E0|nr:TrkA C-terminal domain-containing protein [Clostridium bowmanii]MBU3188388.1 TrkA C-terminal domain-containing protein [Clostridium bowmanii]MCA1072777.1 TrkA C-terminal domain-containing protein [Clostridium bowmanii]